MGNPQLTGPAAPFVARLAIDRQYLFWALTYIKCWGFLTMPILGPKAHQCWCYLEPQGCDCHDFVLPIWHMGVTTKIRPRCIYSVDTFICVASGVGQPSKSKYCSGLKNSQYLIPYSFRKDVATVSDTSNIPDSGNYRGSAGVLASE